MDSIQPLLAALQSPDTLARNHAAVALMDLQTDAAICPLIEAIENPAHRNERGTLIYALSGFDCKDKFPQLFRWAIEGGFEATGEALSIIREQDVQADANALGECKLLLDQAYIHGAVDPDLFLELRELLSQNGD